MSGKRRVLLAAVALIIIGLCSTPCLALNNVGSASKKGSLLIFPKILTIPGVDTIITLGNDYPNSVLVKCYWMDNTQRSWDFAFRLTPYQPVWFAASTGIGSVEVAGFGEGKQGELKCWAIKELPDPKNPGGTIETQISWNDLYGSAMIYGTTPPSAAEYDAFAFAARNVARGNAVISPPDTGPGNLLLNGSTSDIGYDACPAYLTFNFWAQQASSPTGVNSGSVVGQDGLGLTPCKQDLVLAPCRQDLRQDSGPVCTKARFDIWNENETKFTGSYQCVKCWFEGILSEIGTDTWEQCDLFRLANGTCKATGVGGKKFTSTYLKTDLGRFRVVPETFAACKGVFAKVGQDGKTPSDVCGNASNQTKTPFLGLLLTGIDCSSNILFSRTVVTSPSFAGAWNAGDPGQPIPGILWDPGSGDQAGAKR
jgi:hypothetical protein